MDTPNAHPRKPGDATDQQARMDGAMNARPLPAATPGTIDVNRRQPQGRSPGLQAMRLHRPDHLPVQSTVVNRSGLACLPLRGQRWNCCFPRSESIAGTTHQIPVSPDQTIRHLWRREVYLKSREWRNGNWEWEKHAAFHRKWLQPRCPCVDSSQSIVAEATSYKKTRRSIAPRSASHRPSRAGSMDTSGSRPIRG